MTLGEPLSWAGGGRLCHCLDHIATLPALRRPGGARRGHRRLPGGGGRIHEPPPAWARVPRRRPYVAARPRRLARALTLRAVDVPAWPPSATVLAAACDAAACERADRDASAEYLPGSRPARCNADAAVCGCAEAMADVHRQYASCPGADEARAAMEERLHGICGRPTATSLAAVASDAGCAGVVRRRHWSSPGAVHPVHVPQLSGRGVHVPGQPDLGVRGGVSSVATRPGERATAHGRPRPSLRPDLTRRGRARGL